ncbi:Spy/CpxP family protein refolding chaperone [Massilia sp. 9I]|uniref:Spy/CpxP family protein refolding chaperone n=1 Tax=Massilia sp. 9I TaxID=2653152 RepID=UPI00135A1C82|nr:periplasmic heavy metal sensor [Massilia sp. 9I]
MTFTSLRAAALLAAACLAGAPAFAQDGPPPPGLDRGPGGPGPHFLRGVDLSEAQQDRLFAIMHEAAPKRREIDKARRKAHEALREAAASASFDDAKAAAAAQALGQAVAADELLRVRTEAQAMALLTPQQREAQRKDRAPRGPRD